MLGAYSNIKTRLFTGGGENESPFLEELRDESVVRAMEEWNMENTDEDSTLEDTGPRERPKRNPFGPPHEPRNDEGPFGHHSHLHPYHDHHGSQNEWILIFTYILKIGILIMSVVLIICVMASTESVQNDCDRPAGAKYVLVIAFLSIVANLGILTICERFNLCCTIGRMEFFYHLLAGVSMSIGIFMYGSWLYNAGMPSSVSSTTSVFATFTPTLMTSESKILESGENTSANATVTSATDANATVAIRTIINAIAADNDTTAEPPNGINETNVTATESSPHNASVVTMLLITTASTVSNSTTGASIVLRKRRQLIEVAPKPANVESDQPDSLKKSNVEAESNCVTSNLGWRDFKYAVASLIIMFGILGTHGAIVLLYFFPCMGLMRRDNQAQAAQRSKLKDSYGQNHQHQRHTTSYGLEMRSRTQNNNNMTVPDQRQAEIVSSGINMAEGNNQMSCKPLIIKDQFMTSSPNVTPTKNQSLLRKVVNSNLWGSTMRSDDRQQKESILHDSVISADQLLETSIEESDAEVNVNTGVVAEINTTGEGDDVLFDAHDSALLHVIVKRASSEKQP